MIESGCPNFKGLSERVDWPGAAMSPLPAVRTRGCTLTCRPGRGLHRSVDAIKAHSQHSRPAPGTGDRNARRPNLAVRPRPQSRGPPPPLVQDRLQETQPTAAPGADHAWLGVAVLRPAQPAAPLP